MNFHEQVEQEVIKDKSNSKTSKVHRCNFN